MEKLKFIRKFISYMRDHRISFILCLNIIVFFYPREKNWSKLAN